jgi:hypothetical protein
MQVANAWRTAPATVASFLNQTTYTRINILHLDSESLFIIGESVIVA